MNWLPQECKGCKADIPKDAGFAWLRHVCNSCWKLCTGCYREPRERGKAYGDLCLHRIDRLHAREHLADADQLP